jgi:hypothetical protein
VFVEAGDQRGWLEYFPYGKTCELVYRRSILADTTALDAWKELALRALPMDSAG